MCIVKRVHLGITFRMPYIGAVFQFGSNKYKKGCFNVNEFEVSRVASNKTQQFGVKETVLSTWSSKTSPVFNKTLRYRSNKQVLMLFCSLLQSPMLFIPANNFKMYSQPIHRTDQLHIAGIAILWDSGVCNEMDTICNYFTRRNKFC